MTQTAKRLSELGIVLPKPAAPVANYVPTVTTGGGAPGAPSLLFVSGQLPREAAQRCAINLLAQAQAALGDLDRVVRLVRLGGFFNVASSFDALPQAMNGASDLMAEVFGERGRHARTTVGVAHLPLNALVEIEALFEISN
jgi:enamine deaminase RidA (YjgF/YER057c/UK114 family)